MFSRVTNLIVVATLLAMPTSNATGQAGLWGAFEGLGRFGEHLQRLQILEEQNKLEMQRLEREHALRMEALRREAEYRDQIDDEQQRRQRQADLEREREDKRRQQAAIERQLEEVKRAQKMHEQEEQFRATQLALVEEKHPGWRKAVNTQSFKNWYSRQPESLKRLAGSDKAEDAITLLDLYKRDQRKSR